MRKSGSLFVLPALGLVVLLAAGCAQTRSIQALPPRPVIPIDSSREALAEAGLARLDVRLRVDGVALPDEVSQLRLRVQAVRLHQVGGDWVDAPSSSGPLSITNDGELARSLVTTRIPAAEYDSVTVLFGDAYVEFGSNAGGPLSVEDQPQAERAFGLTADAGSTHAIDVVLDPGASIFRDASCSWHFLPFVRIEAAEN